MNQPGSSAMVRTYRGVLLTSASSSLFLRDSGCAVRMGTAGPRVLEMEVKGLLPPEFQNKAHSTFIF